MPAGQELMHDPRLGKAERLYIRLLGAPVNGLRNRLRRIRPLLAGDYRRILDAGCGPGVFTYLLARLHPGAEVVGLDIDLQSVETNNLIARKARLPNCRFELGDVLDLPPDGSYDLALSVDNLEHLEDDRGALRSLHRALKPGGRLVAHVPGYYRRWFFFARRVNFEVPTHVRPGYTREEIVGRIEEAGFQVERSFYTYGFLETLSNNLSYLISGAARRRKPLYAAAFPFLLVLSWLGHRSRPSWGAGVAVVARRPEEPTHLRERIGNETCRAAQATPANHAHPLRTALSSLWLLSAAAVYLAIYLWHGAVHTLRLPDLFRRLSGR
jgi:SAM-dependent methyltransferase